MDITPKTMTISGIATFQEATEVERKFESGGFESLGIADLKELEMGEGYDVTFLL